ncbi:putative lipid-binding transport protein (Tim44 family) [Azospirillum fermentarium]|uniref:Tim44/TimA family putative adaptor protein n=1 Tax=Azospirillum fermentarium TaxID=1233114 RepID=UPI002225FAD2|nr:Tim44/TimA family putative adaptor protein [Azospirillum fermentarium]MCW2244556.1 putative lipid-binding transport protein (Tim44 family) [Azospirillum fermentarium]
MGDGFIFIEIVIFAMIAAFLVYRLRSVLGRRDNDEPRRSNPYAPTPTDRAAPHGDNVIPMPGRDRGIADVPPPPAPGEPESLAATLARIAAADRMFEEKNFLQGARAAFTMIVGAFAAGDTATLRPLLADPVYDSFAAAIRQRQQAGQTLETTIHRIVDADVTAARLDGRTVAVTVTFISEQTGVTRDASGAVVDGDPKAVETVTDIWTFTRDIRSNDPNWLLSETVFAD